MKEEHNSAAFRSAVCLACSKQVGSTKCTPEVIVIVGPSASGKSSAQDAVTKQLFAEDPSVGSEQNKLMMIDGAVEREQSQMARLLLDFSNNQGYQGVVGLHEHNSILSTTCVTSIKKRIEKAITTNAEKDISVVIPLTFAGQGGLQGDKSSKLLMWMSSGIKRYVDFAAKRGSGITLVEVVGKQPDDFQKTTKPGKHHPWR